MSKKALPMMMSMLRRLALCAAGVLAAAAAAPPPPLRPNAPGQPQELREVSGVCAGRSAICSALLDAPVACMDGVRPMRASGGTLTNHIRL
jgi:hypothetical protein